MRPFSEWYLNYNVSTLITSNENEGGRGCSRASYDEWSLRFRVIQRILDELDEELLLLEVAGCQIFLQPLEELCRDLYRQGAFCFHADLSSFEVFGEDALHIFLSLIHI